ncbi:queuine tRNAribosyltransferase [Acanthamoeba castellanii str. Neff]|uniref:Queuine tRNAribosyltransferase n=1 Tax=Acanthamoeba castellanii (strain ATCC 30010 / Neff) TaxID=1257118 RepID=L8GTR6_ACACF|nr:queuine tRNAribosyltransferase [Acanthamoeba castellanii str. Neff]ELR15511.1 queuine tRNAribosyltransferase [Acanthamoeba castellanii str. Neff]
MASPFAMGRRIARPGHCFTSLVHLRHSRFSTNSTSSPSSPDQSLASSSSSSSVYPPPPDSGEAAHYAPSSFPSHSSASYFHFEVLHTSKRSGARVGRIHTPHGVIETPGFVAVGTNGTLKHISTLHGNEMGVQAMFMNTYHLLLHPGPDVISSAGGLHKFIQHKTPIMTDSGGFQVMSMASRDQFIYSHQLPEEKEEEEAARREAEAEAQGIGDERSKKLLARARDREKNEESGYISLVQRINEDGVYFKSYRDGTEVVLTPETSVAYQKSFGADIIIPLDELPPVNCTDHNRLLNSLHRTHRWEARSLLAHKKDPRDQAMYAVLHGGVDRELRQLSIDYLTQLPFDGFAIGSSTSAGPSLLVGDLVSLVEWMSPKLPKDKPCHLLGIGDLESIGDCVAFGIDTFDSAYPTRIGRHGTILTRQGKKSITKIENKHKHAPMDPGCSCFTCRNYSASYLYHLHKAYEPVGMQLTTIHNLHFMLNYFKDVREKIMRDEI